MSGMDCDAVAGQAFRDQRQADSDRSEERLRSDARQQRPVAARMRRAPERNRVPGLAPAADVGYFPRLA